MSTPTNYNNKKKPHKWNEKAWGRISRLGSESELGLHHFRIIRRIGEGDIGRVYLCQIRSSDPEISSLYYAMKVINKKQVSLKNKLHRAEMEKRILSILDHPFLPTLYAHFDSPLYSFLLLDYCPAGDLFTNRFRQPRHVFPLSSAKFYGAETLLAIEYLHILGIVYRDLKPENVLLREDGHIMLTDFDLSFKFDVAPKLFLAPTRTNCQSSSSSSYSSVCASPMQPVISCFRGREERAEFGGEIVVEEGGGRSRSMVGTHEYLAPEMVRGCGHGRSVDWWAFGVFMYELIYGSTPFKGEDNKTTMTNIVKKELRFPSRADGEGGEVGMMAKARDLIARLLVKNPERRLGSVKGAMEIRRHPFFRDVNWALVRSMKPPPHVFENQQVRIKKGHKEDEEDLSLF